MRSLQRLVAILLIAVFILPLLPLQASAAPTDANSDLSVIFQDDFSGGNLSKWKRIAGEYTVKEEIAYSTDWRAQYAPLTAQAPNGIYLDGNAIFEFDVKPLDSWGGIQFGLENQNEMNWDQTGYLVFVTPQGTLDMFKSTGNGKVSLASVNVPNFDSDAFTHVRIVYTQETSNIQVYLNGETTPSVNYSDDQNAGGRGAYEEGYILLTSDWAAIDNVSISGKDMTDAVIQDFIEEGFILYKPIRDTAKIEYPTLPNGLEVEFVSAEPAGYIDENWNVLKRPETGEADIPVDVTVRFQIDGNDDPIEKTYTVPIPAQYERPNISETEIEAAHEAFGLQKNGLFVHYVAGLTCDTNGMRIDDVDVLAESFDAEQFAKDAHDFGVEYVTFSCWHANTIALYPSEVNKRWRDDRRSEDSTAAKTYSNTDVIEELYQALEQYDIDLHLYVHPVDGHDFTEEDKKLCGYYECLADGSHEQWNQYINELFDEMVKRYAGKIKGLWIDGEFQHWWYMHPMIDQEAFRNTCTAYDPTIILTANMAMDRAEQSGPKFPAADYNAWEIASPESTTHGFIGVNPNAKSNDSDTWPVTQEQVALLVGYNWWTTGAQNNQVSAPYSAEDLYVYTVLEASISNAGGVNLSVACYPGGDGVTNLWEGNVKEVLTNLNKDYIAPVAESIRNTKAGIAFPTQEQAWLEQMDWGVSTESADGKQIYLHVLRQPGDSTLELGLPADGSELSSTGTILHFNGTTTEVTVQETENGYSITLPEGVQWDALDTIIRVARAEEEETSFTVTFNTNGGTEIAPMEVENGATVAKPADPTKAGYTFAGWYSDADLTTAYNFDTAVTTDITLYAKWNEDSGSTGTTTSYTITVTQNEGGTISPSSARVTRGGSKTFTITAKEGYKISDVLVDGKSVGAVSSYTFENVKAKHTITAKFEKVEEITNVGGFTDVKSNDWFAEAVQYVVDEGLMNGTSETTFSPKGVTTRGMIVTILYRQAGSPEVESDGKTWWSDARAWAMANGISDGTNMEKSITREQLATMLYRYAELMGEDVSKRADLEDFQDASKVSTYAAEALKWAAAEGIVTGKTGGILYPQAGATRAETAAMFMRFAQ